MLDRIKLILKDKDLTPSVFADTIGVSRGTVSHILNGRNDKKCLPSANTIDKILKTFPDISPAWFMNGLGQMYKHERIMINPDSSKNNREPDLFAENQPVKPSNESAHNEYPPKIEVKAPVEPTKPVEIKEINLPEITSKKIDKIIIFFSDKTFMTFISEE